MGTAYAVVAVGCIYHVPTPVTQARLGCIAGSAQELWGGGGGSLGKAFLPALGPDRPGSGTGSCRQWKCARGVMHSIIHVLSYTLA